MRIKSLDGSTLRPSPINIQASKSCESERAALRKGQEDEEGAGGRSIDDAAKKDHDSPSRGQLSLLDRIGTARIVQVREAGEEEMDSEAPVAGTTVGLDTNDDISSPDSIREGESKLTAVAMGQEQLEPQQQPQPQPQPQPTPPPSSTAVIPLDPLCAYLRRVGRHVFRTHSSYAAIALHKLLFYCQADVLPDLPKKIAQPIATRIVADSIVSAEALFIRHIGSVLKRGGRSARRAREMGVTCLEQEEKVSASMEAAAEFDVTAALHLSVDRLPALLRFVEAWNGPVSATVYAADSDLEEIDRFLEHLQLSFSSSSSSASSSNAHSSVTTLASISSFSLHLVFKEGTVYPVNFLRNVALDGVRTSHVLMVDVDLVPSKDAHSHLRDLVSGAPAALGGRKEEGGLGEIENSQSPRRTQGSDSSPSPPQSITMTKRTAIVVPAFESFSYTTTLLPANKSDVQAWVDAGQLRPFREQEWPQGHKMTNFSHWLHADQPYSTKPNAGAEPYIALAMPAPK